MNLGYKTLAGKIIRLPLRLLPDDSVVPVIRGPLRGMSWISGSSIHGCWLGTYESDKVSYICSQPLSGRQFLDIGANVGFYSLLAASRGASVVAFEPLPRNLSYLQRHISMNRVNVQVLPCAVSDVDGEASFDDRRGFSEGRISESGELSVKAVRLDSLGLNPAVIKIDVEGGEAHVLAGARETIKVSKPVIFLATHGRDVESQCLALLSAMGYTSKPIAENEYLCHYEVGGTNC